jgi:translation initiation factor IF-2
MEQSLEVYAKELKEKNQQKRVAFEAKVKEEEKAEIHALTERFNNLKQDLVQDTVKEVLKRYGDS